jgi:hypothetical protein
MTKPNSSRRAFMHQLAALAGVVIVPSMLRAGSAVRPGEITNEQICQRKLALAVKESLGILPIGDVMVTVGSSFIGAPYVAGTLEQPGEERLVVNLQGFDCVTFVESTLALSRCIKSGKHSFEDFKKQLQLIRYRRGRIDGYPSRLHYFSDWIDDNAGKNVVRNISQEIGGVAYEKPVTFMSSHFSSYKQLADKSFLGKIKELESLISDRLHFSVPKERVKSVEQKLDSGDVIGITTSTDGLDIIHTGMALRVNGILKYLHAPLSTGKVQITEHSLVDYLSTRKSQTGIMVARPLEPAL